MRSSLIHARHRLAALDTMLPVVSLPILLGLVVGWNGGPGVTAHFSKPVSLAYWISFFLWLWLLMALGTRAMRGALAPWPVRPLTVIFAGGVLGGLVSRPVYSAHQRFFFDRFLPPGTSYHIWSPLPQDLAEARGVALQALFAATLWVIAQWMAQRFRVGGFVAPAIESAIAEPVSAPVGTSDLPRLARVASIRDVGDIVMVRAQDHYLHIDTRNGSRTALYRFRDAIEDLASLPGIQIHRSFWVRLDAIREFDAVNERVRGTFADGAWVPVQKKYAPVLSAALKSYG